MTALRLAMTFRYNFTISRPDTPEVCYKFPYPPVRGRRECRAPDAPDSRVCNGSGRTHTRWSGHTGITRHSPRNGFTAYIVLSPVSRAFLPPSPLRSLLLKNLTPASGCQDHTTSPSASAPFVKSASASTASCPASVTISSRPSVGQDGKSYSLICISEKQKYFCKRGWTGFCLTGKSPERDNLLDVVPAKAGTHTPRPLCLALRPDGFPTTYIGGYGSLLSPGRLVDAQSRYGYASTPSSVLGNGTPGR
ncbi:hypothetical protein SAMN05444159_0320 [Bradyrhizobium lablabi]|uniref:Uncharacterized protein n=1 Tax=Bradyrhizobium lablabi TaxID=722472 RepID=A0A1M6IEA4_9BRAD|nr:hypothetical protein SAMN05444159_0320 [Bradyrhizobium lablabi]